MIIIFLIFFSFLQLTYVDRVVHEARIVERDYFTLCNWTAEALSERQRMEIAAGGFGLGFIDSDMEESVDLSRSEVSYNVKNKGIASSSSSYASPKVYVLVL